jgi:hypothetical protein
VVVPPCLVHSKHALRLNATVPTVEGSGELSAARAGWTPTSGLPGSCVTASSPCSRTTPQPEREPDPKPRPSSMSMSPTSPDANPCTTRRSRNTSPPRSPPTRPPASVLARMRGVVGAPPGNVPPSEVAGVVVVHLSSDEGQRLCRLGQGVSGFRPARPRGVGNGQDAGD